MVERGTVNPQVAGSNPVSGAMQKESGFSLALFAYPETGLSQRQRFSQGKYRSRWFGLVTNNGSSSIAQSPGPGLGLGLAQKTWQINPIATLKIFCSISRIY